MPDGAAARLGRRARSRGAHLAGGVVDQHFVRGLPAPPFADNEQVPGVVGVFDEHVSEVAGELGISCEIASVTALPRSTCSGGKRDFQIENTGITSLLRVASRVLRLTPIPTARASAKPSRLSPAAARPGPRPGAWRSWRAHRRSARVAATGPPCLNPLSDCGSRWRSSPTRTPPSSSTRPRCSARSSSSSKNAQPKE